MTPEQLAFKSTESPTDYVGDVPRYYVWQERPRLPDHEGGEDPIDWTRTDRGGSL